MKRDFAGCAARGIVAARFPAIGLTAMNDPARRRPTEDEIAAINARHLIDIPLRPADLLFVFGTRQDVDERVAEAARLWRGSYFRWAIVSGGVTLGSERSECEIIAEAM